MSTSPEPHAAPLLALRAGTATLALAAVGLATLQLALPPLSGLRLVYDGGTLGFADALEALCAVLMLLCWAWLQTIAVLVTAAAAARCCRGERIARRAQDVAITLAPTMLRRLLMTGCGAALGVGAVALPASAAVEAPPDAATATVSVPPLLDGLQLPDRTTGGADHRMVVVVRPGDSLWSIARRLLPTRADDDQVSAAWHRLAIANRAVIGPDPDLIQPGTRLRVPAHRRDAT